jgi:TolA-binding protein
MKKYYFVAIFLFAFVFLGATQIAYSETEAKLEELSSQQERLEQMKVLVNSFFVLAEKSDKQEAIESALNNVISKIDSIQERIKDRVERIEEKKRKQKEGQRLAEEQKQKEKRITHSGSEFGGRIDDYFPVITSFSTTPPPSTPLKSGDKIYLRVEVNEPHKRQVLYSWWCSSCGLPSAPYKIWTNNNEINYKITAEDIKKSGEVMRIGVRIKSEKEYYRTGIHGYDDGVYTDYRFSF